jgi:hypothetical protein
MRIASPVVTPTVLCAALLTAPAMVSDLPDTGRRICVRTSTGIACYVTFLFASRSTWLTVRYPGQGLQQIRGTAHGRSALALAGRNHLLVGELAARAKSPVDIVQGTRTDFADLPRPDHCAPGPAPGSTAPRPKPLPVELTGTSTVGTAQRSPDPLSAAVTPSPAADKAPAATVARRRR